MNKADDRFAADPVPEPAPVPVFTNEPLDIEAIIEALESARGTFLQRIASPRFLLVLLAQIPILVGWLHGNVAGEWAIPAAAALTALYTIGETFVHVSSIRAASDVASVHVAASSGKAAITLRSVQ